MRQSLGPSMPLKSFFMAEYMYIGYMYHIFIHSYLWPFRLFPYPGYFKLSELLEIQRIISSVQSLSNVQLFATQWTAAPQASLSITNSRSLPKLMSTDSVIQSNHPILCHPLLLLPSIFPSIRVFSNESALRIRWSKCWSFSLKPQSFQ